MPQQLDPAGDGEPPAQGSSAQPELFRFDNVAMPSSREVLAERILLTLLARPEQDVNEGAVMAVYLVKLADALIRELAR